MSESRFEEDLLRSAEGDAPSAERRRASRAAVMHAAGFAPAPKTPAPEPTTPSTAPAATAKSLTLAKVAAVAALGAALVGGASAVRSASPSDRSPPLPPSATASADTPPIASAQLLADAGPAAVPEVAPPVVPNVVSAAPAEAAAPGRVAPRDTTDPLALEARLLEAARRCLDAGDTACASRKLAEHRAAFPPPALADEAALLRIELARANGDQAGARDLAEALLRDSPSGPYARRARAILASIGADAGRP